MSDREPADAMWREALAAHQRDSGVSIAERADEHDECDDVDEERCFECDDTGRCWACNGYDPGDDLGSGCSECDGWGHCWCGAGS